MLPEKSSDLPPPDPVETSDPGENAGPDLTATTEVPAENLPGALDEVVAEPPPEPLETVPVSEERAEKAGFAGQLLEACPSCGTLMDVTQQAPFAQIFCPSCGQNLRARKQFNNYRLVELLGEGGMGSVFKAVDCNLNRNVALKILKKELSASEEERAKLAEEARITASINHPHVVKVFLFGEDHGQFYLAMELVGKGTLDDLINLQRRVGEAHMLEVGIQIAEGLAAALEHGLIHRDIKPGNILFADPHTAKLVDFGLAIVMDEAASKVGEIWGTPYYIAPEKLDNLPEDFRSDIYSLGGTMFHALSGRPPYEAETASMVALKQLKSQPISLQAFAPDVSSETAYVINRMLAKNPDDRYNSYEELIQHLTYARNKLLERAQKPLRPKERVVMETQTTKNLAAFLSLGLLAALLACGLVVYAFRDSIFNLDPNRAKAGQSAYNEAEMREFFNQAVQRMNDRQFAEARDEFGRLADVPGTPQPMKNWVRMNHALATLMAGESEKAADMFEKLAAEDLYSTAPEDTIVANFFGQASKHLTKPGEVIPRSITNLFSNQNAEAFGLLCFGLHDWEAGAVTDAGPILTAFSRARVKPPEEWILDYKPLANFYLEDYKKLSPIEASLARVKDAAAAQTLLGRVRQARDELPPESRVVERLNAIEQELIAKGAKP